jgi:predicted O-methyltransferase YrrM
MNIIPEKIDTKTFEYIVKHTANDDDYLKKVLDEMEKNNIRKINITPYDGNIISTLISMIRPKRGVEVGTLCGYSSLWISKAMDDSSKLYTIEKEPQHAEIASKIFAELGLERKIILMNSEAKEALTKLSKTGQFDFCFIDANKDDYPFYIKWAIKNLKSGGLLLAHNPLMKGNLFYDGDDKEQNRKSRGMREFLHILFTDESFAHRAIIPTSDGIALGIMK